MHRRWASLGIIALAVGLWSAPAAGAAVTSPSATARGTHDLTGAAVSTPGPLTRLTASSDITATALVPHNDKQSTLDTLDGEMPVRTVHTVLTSANHAMTTACRASESAAAPIAPAATSVHCWESGDAASQLWIPQGLTTSGDASSTGTYAGDSVILSGWSYNLSSDPPGHDASMNDWARIAFVDTGTWRYRWALLVVPTSAGTDFRPLISHLGGMAWYGDRLYVTSRSGDPDANQLYVFSLRQILQPQVNSTAVGKVPGGYSAGGYQYVLPAVGSYSIASDATCSMSSGTGVPCYAGLSLDRTTSPVSIVANEWFSSGDTTPARLFRYPLAADGSLALTGGQALASEVWRTTAVGLQGAVSHNGDWYAADARGGVDQHGILWHLRTTGAATSRTCTGVDLPNACWAQHSEGMTMWDSTLWSQTEWAADANARWLPPAIPQRVLISVPLASAG